MKLILDRFKWFSQTDKYYKSQATSIFIVVIFIMLTGNYSLLKALVGAYPVSFDNIPFLISLIIFFTFLTAIFFIAVCYGKLTRWTLAIFLIIASQSAYYMDSLGVIIDTVMIDNVMQTNRTEFASLVTFDLILRTVLLGIVPAVLVIRYSPTPENFAIEIKTKLRLIAILIIGVVLIVVPFSAGYYSFIREHKIIRYYANPTYSVYSFIKYISQQTSISATNSPLKKNAEDAVLNETVPNTKELIILVVGETARADRFSLNGYKRETNPLLSKLNVLSFTNVTSCGTSTSVSVPCMFSSLGRKKYDKKAGLAQENALDVLKKNGVEVLWRDNNSDSKGVGTRIEYQDFKSPTMNPICKGECRDIGMLSGLDEFISSKNDKDILIVLHQMGNHGPEYYRRYPKEFERFKPACQTGELKDCTQSEIDNAYDNAILYTDYFLSEVIGFLKKYDDRYETAMMYVADHGESLGEGGFYLHAAPYVIAPNEQTHVPAIFWAGKNFDYKLNDLISYKDKKFSHDYLFCTLLVSYELSTSMCEGKQ